jgi:hypothetical protein
MIDDEAACDLFRLPQKVAFQRATQASTKREDGGCKGERGRLSPTHGLTVLCMYINDTHQTRWHQMLEVILVYVGVQALIMLYGREPPTHVKNKQD